MMPGRVKLTSTASVDTLPTTIRKRRISTSPVPPAKRTRSDTERTALPGDAAVQARSSQTTSSSTSSQPENVGSGTAPLSSYSSTVGQSQSASHQCAVSRAKRYSCTYEGCSKFFARPCRLDEHLRSHTGERPFKCTADPENCDKSFLRDSHLKAHVKSMHMKEKPHRCTFIIPPGGEHLGEFGFKRKASEPADGPDDGNGRECGARFSTNQHLRRHLESHMKTFPYICKDFPPCTAGFRKKGPLARHVRSEHQGLQAWACPHKDLNDKNQPCSAAFDTKGKLGNHVATQHNGMARRRYICTNCITSEAPTLQPDTIATQQADAPVDQSTEDASLLLGLSRQPFPIIQKNHEPKMDAATYRTQGMLGFTTHAELRDHIIRAHPPVCTQCGFVAKRHREIRTHFREKHELTVEERKTWICGWEDCGQGFTKKNNLKTHTRTVHHGLKPFACTHESCDKRFGHKAVLVNHVSVCHTTKKQRQEANMAARASRKRRTKGLSIAQQLTGVGYEGSGRNIPCVVGHCEYRFCRMYDLKKHLAARSAHGLGKEQVEELMKRAKVEELVKSHDEEESESGSESEWSLAGSETEDDE